MFQPPFTALARVYDEIMVDVEYDEWCDFILRETGRRGFDGSAVLDLGCGTGNIAIRLARRGLQVTGLDGSAEMLEVARQKAPDLEWLRGDFTSFSIPERFGLVVSAFDSLNNLIDPGAFAAAAGRVHAHLLPGGLFLFDVNTRAGLIDLWEGDAVEGWAGEIYYRWEHSFDESTGLARVEAFCDDGESSFTEVHFERPYEIEELRELLDGAGFEPLEFLDYPSGETPPVDAERVWVCATRPLNPGRTAP